VENLYVIVIPLATYLLLERVVRWCREREQSPEYLRKNGVIVKLIEALDATSEVIGSYRGTPIFGRVDFKGMAYEFAGVLPTTRMARIRENQLYLPPGLLYVTTSR